MIVKRKRGKIIQRPDISRSKPRGISGQRKAYSKSLPAAGEDLASVKKIRSTYIVMRSRACTFFGVLTPLARNQKGKTKQDGEFCRDW